MFLLSIIANFTFTYNYVPPSNVRIPVDYKDFTGTCWPQYSDSSLTLLLN